MPTSISFTTPQGLGGQVDPLTALQQYQLDPTQLLARRLMTQQPQDNARTPTQAAWQSIGNIGNNLLGVALAKGGQRRMEQQQIGDAQAFQQAFQAATGPDPATGQPRDASAQMTALAQALQGNSRLAPYATQMQMGTLQSRAQAQENAPHMPTPADLQRLGIDPSRAPVGMMIGPGGQPVFDPHDPRQAAVMDAIHAMTNPVRGGGTSGTIFPQLNPDIQRGYGTIPGVSAIMGGGGQGGAPPGVLGPGGGVATTPGQMPPRPMSPQQGAGGPALPPGVAPQPTGRPMPPVPGGQPGVDRPYVPSDFPGSSPADAQSMAESANQVQPMQGGQPGGAPPPTTGPNVPMQRQPLPPMPGTANPAMGAQPPQPMPVGPGTQTAQLQPRGPAGRPPAGPSVTPGEPQYAQPPALRGGVVMPTTPPPNSPEGAQQRYIAEHVLGPQLGAAVSGGTAGRQALQHLDRIEAIYRDIDSGGPLATLSLRLRSAAQELGLPVGEVSQEQAAQAVSSEMALQMRNPSGGAGMPGAMSDSDREMLVGMSPGLAQTPQGRQLIIDMRRRMAQRDVEVASFANRYARDHGGIIDFNFQDALGEHFGSRPLFGPDFQQRMNQITGRPAPGAPPPPAGVPGAAQAAPATPGAQAPVVRWERRPDGSYGPAQ